MNGIPEVTNAWLSLAHDEFGADAGPVARRRHPDFLRTVQFVLPGVAQVRRPQTIAAIAGPSRRRARNDALVPASEARTSPWGERFDYPGGAAGAPWQRSRPTAGPEKRSPRAVQA